MAGLEEEKLKGQRRNLRRRAERVLKSRESDISKLGQGDIARLVHELEVHQVELELQNEELHRTQVELMQSRQRYQELYDYAPAGYFTLEAGTNRILEVNLAGSILLGVERKRLVKSRFTTYLEPDFADIFHFSRRKAFAGPNKESLELKMHRSDGTVFWTWLEMQPASFGDLNCLYLTLVDITPRKMAEEALARARDELEIKVRERTAELEKANASLQIEIQQHQQTAEALKQSQSRLQQVFQSAFDGIMVIDTRGNILDVNRAIVESLGIPRKNIIGKSVLDFINSKNSSVAVEDWKELQAARLLKNREYEFTRADGTRLTVEINASELKDINGTIHGYVITIRDVTERKLMERSLKEYTRRITQIQEEERKRIAYELHDDTAQYLSILKMQLDSLLQSGKIQDPEIRERLQYLEKDANRAFNDVRRYSHELRPEVLEHQGLVAAIEQLVEDINKLNHFELEVNVTGSEPELAEEVKLGFFRIAQEALNNIRKHAKADRASISLDFQKKKLRMTVGDNGRGFDTREIKDRAALKGNLGLMSMRERANLIGADLKIESRPGEGTRVTLEIRL